MKDQILKHQRSFEHRGCLFGPRPWGVGTEINTPHGDLILCDDFYYAKPAWAGEWEWEEYEYDTINDTLQWMQKCVAKMENGPARPKMLSLSEALMVVGSTLVLSTLLLLLGRSL